MFLRQTMRLDLDADAALTLEKRTEGWIAGLQMAALSLQHHAETEGLDEDLVQQVADFCGGHRYVIDYMAAEVLRQQPGHICDFLRETATLGRLCAPLCDAVTGRSDGKAVLARLEQSNMFLVPLDDERRWYRYHQLFADFLRAGLTPDRERAIHLRASAWYEGEGLGQEAMRHALAARDVAATVRIFRSQVDAMLGRGEIPTLLAWLEALPDDTIRAHSDLAGYKAWLLYLCGKSAEAQVYSELAQAIAHADAPAPQRGMLCALQAYLTLNWGDPKDAIPLARQALELLGDSASFFRVYALSFLGQAQGLSGDRRAGTQTLRAAVDLGQKLGNHLLTLDAIGHLARTMLAQGRLREGIVLCREAAERYVDARGKPLPVAGLLYVCLGALHYEADELEWAERCLATGVALCQQLGLVYYTLIGQRALAKLQHVGGQRETAWNTLAAAREVAERSEAPRRRHFVEVLGAELHLREGNVAAAARALGNARRILPSGSEHESLTQARLLAQHHAGTAADLLGQLERAATKDECDGLLIAIHVLQGLCRNAMGQRAAALESLERAVSLGAAAGYRRVFLDEGPGLLALLRQAPRQAAAAFVSSLLESTSTESRAGGATRALPEPLSRTELEILGLLDRGLTNQEIADELSITVGTAVALNHIFGKLMVHSRTMALARARELKLL
jgi:LuxR family maltose regulon positive regulatory protein